MNERISTFSGLKALSPLAVFLLLYVGFSLSTGDFYAVPISVAFLISCLYAVLILRHRPWEERFALLTEGARRPGLLMMVWIFVLAGAFTGAAKAIGAIDAMVNLSLALLPQSLVMGGLFLASCLISVCVGTSVGTIAALTPIAVSLAGQTGQSVPLLVAIAVGGAYFGDNLSFISDTTIVATRSQGCRMGDKFRKNIWIAGPAALITLALYLIMGARQTSAPPPGEVDYLLVVPYFFVLLTALLGMNVTAVLALGAGLAGLLGIATGCLDMQAWMNAMSGGILGMGELIIVTLLAGGLIEIIRETGGIRYLIQVLTRRINGCKGAECCIAALVVLTDFCTANNTIAILTVGPLAKEISTRYHVDPRRSASILDTFSCFAQGIIPYGAQLLIASGLAGITPLSIIPYLYYPFILGIVALINIFLHYEEIFHRHAASVHAGSMHP